MADTDDFDRDESHEEEAPATPKNNLLTIVLLLLNVVAALAFVYLIAMDYQKRQEWAYAVFLHDFDLQGVPQKADDDAQTAASETLPRQRLSDKDLEAVFSKRGGSRGGVFAPVDEYLHSRIRPSELNPDTLKAHFGEQPTVKTLEEEIDRLRTKLPADIAAAAKETADKEAAASDKRARLRSILLSLAYDVHQVKRLDELVAKAPDGKLDEMLTDAAERRMYVDLLAPLEVYRTGDTPTFARQKAANLTAFKGYEKKDNQVVETEHTAYSLDELKKLLDRYFAGLSGKLDSGIQPGSEWDSLEKRRAIAFFLADVAFLQKPDGTPLDPQAMNRGVLVSGLYAFPGAVQSLVQAWNALEKQTLAAIKADREGMEVRSKDDASKFVNIPGFVTKYQEEIQRLADLRLSIQQTEDRLARLKAQNKAAEQLFADRKEHMGEVGKRIVEARKKTAAKVAELRDFQLELFGATKQLSEAAERNEGLERQIDRLEKQLIEQERLKGAKAP